MAFSWTQEMPLTAGGISWKSGGAARSRRAAPAPAVSDSNWRRESLMPSLYVHALLLFGLGGGVQLLHDGALAIAFGFELEAVVNGGESDMGLGEVGRLLHDRFQFAA